MKGRVSGLGRKSYYAVRRAAGQVRNLITDRGPKLLVLTYHRVLSDRRDDPLGTIISEKKFIRQLDLLAKKFRIRALGDSIDDFRRDGAKTCAVLSFDDGYVDNYEVVLPILKRKGFPAAFFISSGYIGSGRPMWDWQVIMSVTHDAGAREVRLGGERMVIRERESRLSFALRIADGLKNASPDDLREVLSSLGSAYDFSGDRCMDWEELKRLKEAGMEIGSHGISHRSLARIPIGDAEREINESKRNISEHIGRECGYFSFPFGSEKDYNDDLIARVRGSGYRACLLNIHGYNRPSPETFALKRIIMDEDTPVNYILG